MDTPVIRVPSVGADGVLVELDESDPRPLAVCRAALVTLKKKLAEQEERKLLMSKPVTITNTVMPEVTIPADPAPPSAADQVAAQTNMANKLLDETLAISRAAEERT